MLQAGGNLGLRVLSGGPAPPCPSRPRPQVNEANGHPGSCCRGAAIGRRRRKGAPPRIGFGTHGLIQALDNRAARYPLVVSAGPRHGPGITWQEPRWTQTCGRGRAGPGPLPFASSRCWRRSAGWTRARRAPGGEATDPAEPWAWFPTAARSSSPRKCPVARSGQREKPLSGPGSEDERGKGAVALNFAK